MGDLAVKWIEFSSFHRMPTSTTHCFNDHLNVMKRKNGKLFGRAISGSCFDRTCVHLMTLSWNSYYGFFSWTDILSTNTQKVLFLIDPIQNFNGIENDESLIRLLFRVSLLKYKECKC